MNLIFVLFGMCLFAGVISVWVGLKNSRERSISRRGTHRSTLCTILACVLAACMASAARSQEVVHAVTGTLTAANTTSDTFSLTTDDGSVALFQASAVKKTPVTFSKEVEAQTVAANSFHTVGAQVLVFYYGVGTVRTAVAIRSLGTESLLRVNGSVKNFDKHRHAMTIDRNASTPVDVLLSGDTIVDTPDGVVEGMKYHPNKGEHASAVITSTPGAQTAVFISAVGPNASMS